MKKKKQRFNAYNPRSDTRKYLSSGIGLEMNEYIRSWATMQKNKKRFNAYNPRLVNISSQDKSSEIGLGVNEYIRSWAIMN